MTHASTVGAQRFAMYGRVGGFSADQQAASGESDPTGWMSGSFAVVPSSWFAPAEEQASDDSIAELGSGDESGRRLTASRGGGGGTSSSANRGSSASANGVRNANGRIRVVARGGGARHAEGYPEWLRHAHWYRERLAFVER